MRRIADLSPGNAKTDARDAAVIAQAAATMPHTLRDVTAADEEAVLHDLWASRVGYIGATGQARAFYGLDNTTVQGMELLP